MAELFRMMQAMHDQFEDAYEAQDDRDFDHIPPFFRMMQEKQDQPRHRPPMPGKPGSGRRFFDPESGIPPFPCFMMDPQYDDADYDDYDEYEDHETDEDTRSNEQEDRRPPFGGPLSAMLRHMFYASDYDEFYED